MSGYLAEPAASSASAQTAILLVNLGSPETPTPPAVKRYLGEFLADPRIVEMPRALWWLLSGEYRATPDRNLSGLATPSRISLLVILGGIAMGGVLWIIGQALS